VDERRTSRLYTITHPPSLPPFLLICLPTYNLPAALCKVRTRRSQAEDDEGFAVGPVLDDLSSGEEGGREEGEG